MEQCQPPLEGTKNFGIGMCLRDKHDNFIKAKSSNISGNPSPREVEAWALHKALQWLEQLQLSNVTIESDCKVVTDNFNSCCKGISDYNATSLLNSKFYDEFYKKTS
ncbi:hypothetical protein GmHk_06G017571 [Glycine max]|nr:hypothetical protein GmHk_06G017571 [Glycine max]